MKVTEKEAGRLSKHLGTSEKLAKSHIVWTEARELEVVQKIDNGESVHKIIKDLHISGRKIVEIRKKYKRYGA